MIAMQHERRLCTCDSVAGLTWVQGRGVSRGAGAAAGAAADPCAVLQASVRSSCRLERPGKSPGPVLDRRSTCGCGSRGGWCGGGARVNGESSEPAHGTQHPRCHCHHRTRPGTQRHGERAPKALPLVGASGAPLQLRGRRWRLRPWPIARKCGPGTPCRRRRPSAPGHVTWAAVARGKTSGNKEERRRPVGLI